MTTIATDGITIAADGLSNSNGVVMTRRERKIVVEAGAIYALTGTAGLKRPLIDWIAAGADPDRVPKGPDGDSWALLVINRKGAHCYYAKAPYPEDVEYPFTMGSGREVSLGALKAGKSPREAVEIAIDSDVYSGGEIQVVNIAEALGLQPALKVVG